MSKEMTAAQATELLKAAIPAIAYLEAAAQGNVNMDGHVIAETVKSGDDVNGESIFGSWRSKKNATKFGKAAVKMVEFGENQAKYELKLKAIPAEKVLPVKTLAHTAK